MLHIRPTAPGGWLVGVSEGAMLAVDTTEIGGRLSPDAVLEAVRCATPFDATLTLLTAWGVANTPEFVLVVPEAGSGLRCIVRGDARVTVQHKDEAEELSAAEISTWIERAFPEALAYRVQLCGCDATPDAAKFPLREGVAWTDLIASGSVAAAVPKARPAVVHDRAEAAADEPEPAHSAAPTAAPAPGSPPPRPRSIFADDPLPVPAPAAPRFRLQLPGGGIADFDGDVIVGRAPSLAEVSSGRACRLITVTSVDKDVSRSHVRFGVEDGSVLVTDLHSRNGTNTVPPGRPRQRLRPGRPTRVPVGTVVELGGGVSITVATAAGPTTAP